MKRTFLYTLPLLLACLAPPETEVPTPNTASVASLPSEQLWPDPLQDFAAPISAPTRTRSTPKPVIIRHAKILTATGKTLEDASLLIVEGRIKDIGDNSLAAPSDATEIDAKGRVLTPGLIDAHSHLGVYPAPGASSVNDGNEAVAPNTAQVSSGYAYWPQDPQIMRALAGGVTAALILPGSANLIGGTGVTVEMRLGDGIQDVMFPGAPRTLKMACGENPKRVYGNRGGPQTRMGIYAAFREFFQQASEYKAKKAAYQRDRSAWEKRKTSGEKTTKPDMAPMPPSKDAKLEVLADVLSGNTLLEIHCYRASDMLQMVQIADEYGMSIRAFHHALEAYKIRDVLVQHNIAVATWADWWGFKLEAFDGIPQSAGLISASGGRAIIKSDSPIDIQRLNQEAAKAMYAARDIGLDISENEALRWITANPAWALGIEKETGTIEVGKRADLVLWNQHPFSVYARADLVFIAGEQLYDRSKGMTPSDFELGNSALSGGAP